MPYCRKSFTFAPMAKEAGSSFETLSANIKARKFAPVYCFCGEEEFFIDELTALVDTYGLTEMEKAFNQTLVYGKDLSAKQLVEICSRLPMMAERQVVIVKEAQSLEIRKKEDEDALAAYFKKPVPSTVLVFAYKHGTPDKRKAFFKELAKGEGYFESKPLHESQVGTFVRNYLSQQKFKIDPQAAELLVESTGTDLSKLTNELSKLVLNKQPGGTITVDDIERGVGISKEYNSFELNNAIGMRDISKVYKIVNYFILNPKNGPLPMIMGMLYGYFAKVYMTQLNKSLQDREIGMIIKVAPFFVKDYRAALNHYTVPRLRTVFTLLEEYDLRSKGVNNTGGVSEGELMKEMVYRIMHC